MQKAVFFISDCHLWHQRIPYAAANPHHRAIYATGRANPALDHLRKERSRVAKGVVRAVAVERYGVECEGPGRYDQADANILAAAPRERVTPSSRHTFANSFDACGAPVSLWKITPPRLPPRVQATVFQVMAGWLSSLELS
ncbi:hypothetical protein ABT072_40000 [Streptomyces sp. NPDC002589]|uniref:hypothetical protein n=1 Tax=Streptomyces sp. NPDC002589 TaxID=3154420 RepID=UPI00331EA954